MADELQIMEIKEKLEKLEEGQERIEAKLDKLLAASQNGDE